MSALHHLLCADDEEDILEVLKLCLEMSGGYRVSCCSGGRDVLDRVAHIRPDMILLDVMMPGLDGPATFRELRRRTDCRDIPVVFVTASVKAEETHHYLGLGASGVVAKPFDPATLCTNIEAIWRDVQGAGQGKEISR